MVLVCCKFRDLLFKVLIARSSCAQLRNQICHGQGLKYYETLLDPDSAATGELPDEPEPLRLQDLELRPIDDHGLAVLDVADAGGENIPAALAHAPSGSRPRQRALAPVPKCRNVASDDEVCASQEGSEFDGLEVVSEAEDELGNITPQQFHDHDDDDAQFKEDLLQQLFGPAPSPRNPRAGQQDYEDSLYAPSDNDVQDLAAPVPVPDSVRESVVLLADGNDYEEPADDSVRAADDSAAQAKAPRQNQSRDVHPDSFDWGSFRFTFTDASARPPRGQWQAKCRFHKLNDKTWCTRSMTIGSAEGSKDLTLRLLKGWCVQAGKFKKKKDHARMALRPADALPDEVLDSLLGDMPPVPSLVVPDDQMPDEPEPPSHGPPPDPPRKRKHDSSTGDAIDQGACSVKAKGKAKTKAKAKPKAKAKGMPAKAKSEATERKAKAKSKAAKAKQKQSIQDEAASDPPSSCLGSDKLSTDSSDSDSSSESESSSASSSDSDAD